MSDCEFCSVCDARKRVSYLDAGVSGVLFDLAERFELDEFGARLAEEWNFRWNARQENYLEGRIEALRCELWWLLRAVLDSRSLLREELEREHLARKRGAEIRWSVNARARMAKLPRYSMATAISMLTPELRLQIFHRDGNACVQCGATYRESPLHCDHIFPKSLGGPSTPENLQTLCRRCNLKKGASWPGEVAA